MIGSDGAGSADTVITRRVALDDSNPHPQFK